MNVMPERVKDPNAILDYAWNWLKWLNFGETIDSATVTLPVGLSRARADVVGEDRVTAWVAGGTRGMTYTVTCHILTDQGREDERSLKLVIQER